ncbi:MAG: TetR/AcrR family transcriptional regulator [Firmicutes bacterium]|nr:TetR/AcrR family transcriptional regulator [Candidatus Caballimonas caccae]
MTDIRTIKTMQAIRNAFTDMIIEKNNVFFSIKEIADRAKINRKTFYLHFECIEDLYNDLEESTEEKLLEILEKNNFFTSKLSLEIFLKSILELINSNYPLYQKLLIQDNYKFLFRNVKNKVKKQIFEQLKIEGELKNELLFEYVSSGL